MRLVALLEVLVAPTAGLEKAFLGDKRDAACIVLRRAMLMWAGGLGCREVKWAHIWVAEGRGSFRPLLCALFLPSEASCLNSLCLSCQYARGTKTP